MKTILLDRKGDLYIKDIFNGSEEKVDTIKYYMDCQLRIEDGATFEQLFKHIIAEVEIIDVIFSETMGENKLSNFIDEWNKPFTTTNNGLDIEYLRLRKVLEYLEVDKNKGFVDIRVDFEGVGSNMDYGLEFMSLNEMKKFPIKLVDDLFVKESLHRKGGEISYVGGNCVMTLFEVIATLLYEVTFYNPPVEGGKSKQTLIENIDNHNLLEVLEFQLKEAVRIENYEEASNLKTLIDKYKNLGS